MSYRIPYQAKGGKTMDYVVPSYPEMTLAHYRKLAPVVAGYMDPLATIDYRIGVVADISGIPVKVLNGRPMKEVQEVFDFMGEQCIKAMQGSEAFNKAVTEDTGYIPPETITIGGKVYAVPYNLEMDTVAGQWADWSGWDPPEHEADLVAEALAFMLVEQGTKYAGTPKAKVEAMRECLVVDAFDLCAFFFAKSERFRSVTNLRSHKYHTLLSALVERALRLLPSDTEVSASSLQQQS